MILVIVQHYVKPGLVDAAARRIDQNGERMAEVPGFLFRYRLLSTVDDHKVSTVTGWENQAAYDEWLRRRSVGSAPAGESPYARVETEIHTVERTDKPAVAAV